MASSSSTSASAPTATALSSQFSSQIRSKIILITGPSPSSIGHQFALSIAAHAPKLIILAGRSTAKLQGVADAIKQVEQVAADPGAGTPVVVVETRLLKLDLASFKDVRRAADEVLAWADDEVPCVDVLVNNAGIMAHPYGKTEDGLESQFGANHMGHWLFTNLIMDKILRSEAPRVVSVSSDGHRTSGIRFDDLNFAVRET
jgi:NAD(P)-dependent dehydrogenase (short-subunit alcohol dehydrogenase family)